MRSITGMVSICLSVSLTLWMLMIRPLLSATYYLEKKHSSCLCNLNESKQNISKVNVNTFTSAKTEGNVVSGYSFTYDIKRSSILSFFQNEDDKKRQNSPERMRSLATCSIPLIGVVAGLTMESSAKCITRTLEHMSIVFIVDSNDLVPTISSGLHTLYPLNWKDQSEMYPDLDRLIPRSNYARKNLGYLYAINTLNACSIWDFDDDNCLTHETSLALSNLDSLTHTPLQITGDETNNVNPYLLYGSPGGFIWPRGMPMERRAEHFFPRLSALDSQSLTLDVVQFMQSIDPDVDALWRLQNGKSLPLKWNTCPVLQSTTIALGSWAPFNAQSTWLSRRAAVLAYLPFSVHGRVSDIWRSYIMQYILGYEHVGFSGAFVEHYRNNHNYMADMQAERPLYEQAGALVEYLQNRSGNCSSAPTFSECYLGLLDDLYMRGFIEAGDVEAGYRWVEASGASTMMGQTKWISASKVRNQSRVLPQGSEKIIAVLHVNSAMRGVVPLWMAIHGHQFKEVLVYVPGAPGCIPISGIPLVCISSETRGYWAYESMVHAMETRLSMIQNIDSVLRSIPFAEIVGGDPYSEASAAALDAVPPIDSDIDGFLFTHDDVVWAPERVFLDVNNAIIATDAPWSSSTVEWMWTLLHVGARAMERFTHRYRNINGRYGQSDFFYVPLKNAPHFARVGRQMLHSEVFLEIAVPSIIADFRSATKYINLQTSWDESRQNPSVMGKRAMEIAQGPYDLIHPVKMSSLSCVLAHIFYQ